MMKRKIFIAIFSLLLISSLIGNISACFSSLSVTNDFTNGIIDIEINEGQTDNNGANSQMVLPFDEIYKKPYIKNNGSDCFIRAKLVFSNENIVNNSNIKGLNPNWVFNNDGYFYYKKILKTDETITMFDSIKLGDISKQYQLSDFNIDIKVDAIQSKNFIVDFDAEAPWGNVEIAKVNPETLNVKTYRQIPDESFKIIYQDSTKGMVKNFDKFFNNVKTLMPGDYYEDVLEIKNNTKCYQEIHFSTMNVSNNKFLNKVIFNITDENDNIIFNGTLGETKQIIIDTLEAQESSKIKFKIKVPKELGNEFVLNTSSVKWIFSTQHIENISPQTGDTHHVEIYLIVMVISIIGLFFSVRGNKIWQKKSLNTQ